jgi:hypothetical protein
MAGRCSIPSLIVFAIALGIQFLVTAVALLCEPPEDPRSEGDKLKYRS